MDQPRSQDTPMESVVVVRLTRDLRAALRTQAEMEDRSVASLLRVCARAYLDTHPRTS